MAQGVTSPLVGPRFDGDDDSDVADSTARRNGYAEPAAILLARAERGEIQGFACATTVTTVFYLARKAVGRELARGQVGDLLSILNVAPVNRAVLERAAESEIDDFEDAVIVEPARQVQVRAILTRNERDFAKSSIPVYSPIALPALLDTSSSPRA